MQPSKSTSSKIIQLEQDIRCLKNNLNTCGPDSRLRYQQIIKRKTKEIEIFKSKFYGKSTE